MIESHTNANSITRPFDDDYLLSYSDEHIKYEFEMFIWLSEVYNNPPSLICAPGADDVTCLNNALIESFAVHVRNVIANKPRPTDVVAADFFAPGDWTRIRPTISPALRAARDRANKEIAHLTTERKAGNPLENTGRSWIWF